MKILNLSLFLIILSLLSGFSQNRCALGEIQIEKTKIKNHKVNQIIEVYLKQQSNNKTAAEIIRIPVVVHVIHNQEDGAIVGDNISNQQIYSQIRVLNEDFRRKSGTNGHNDLSIGADMELEFYLVNSNPLGGPSNGINRVFNDQLSYSISNGSSDIQVLSNLSYWDSARYLNIWVAPVSGGNLGRAEFPGASLGGLEVQDSEENIDGIIIDYRAFGSQIGAATEGIYSYGRTTTHEVGHWLGLLHTWGNDFCGDDYVNDTPQTERGNLSFDCDEVFSFCSETASKNQIENYMDYSPDLCMNVFTQDQKVRIRAVLELSERRRKLIENAKLINIIENFNVTILGNPSEQNIIRAQVLQPNFANLKITIHNSGGLFLETLEYESIPSTIIDIDLRKFQAGYYIVTFIIDSEKKSFRLLVI